MAKIKTHVRLILPILSVMGMFVAGCKKVDPEVEKRRLITLDSLQREFARDSLEEVALRNALAVRLTMLDQPSIETAKAQSYRMIAEFSWGKSPVGPMLSVMARKDSSRYTFVIHSFPDGKRTEVQKELGEESFRRIAYLFDSVDFVHQPGFLDVDYTKYDASRYFIECTINGQYHGIMRSDTVESYVYDMFSEVLTMANFNPAMIAEFRRLSNERR